MKMGWRESLSDFRALLHDMSRHQHCCDLHPSCFPPTKVKVQMPPVSLMSDILNNPRPNLNVVITDLIRDLGLDTELAKVVLPVLLQNLQTLDRKQQDYGSANLTKFGPLGVVVRMNDKLERIVNLMKKRDHAKNDGLPSTATVLNEPLADSFLDLANYALIAYVMEQKLWPKQ